MLRFKKDQSEVFIAPQKMIAAILLVTDGAIHRIDDRTGTDEVVIRGSVNPQGIVSDCQTNFIATDPGHRRVLKLIIQP